MSYKLFEMKHIIKKTKSLKKNYEKITKDH